MRTTRRYLAIATTAVLFTLGFSAAPAEAAPTWVYIVFPGWLGNCPGSSVYGVQASVSNMWSTNWDYGDDIVYGKVNTGASQSLSYNLACRVGGRPVGYQPGSVTIRPPVGTRTIFVGPSGVRYQNY